MRLFGTVYNDTVHPGDPYEFLSLLSKGNNMVSVQRNDILQEMASLVQDNDRLVDDLKGGNDFDPSFRRVTCSADHLTVKMKLRKLLRWSLKWHQRG
jgi:pyruvate,water dikinase